MSKTIQEQIEVMQHFANGGYEDIKEPTWDWSCFDYRIKEQKKTIIIEKWLLMLDSGEYRVFETSDISLTSINKVKLLETYKVEL